MDEAKILIGDALQVLQTLPAGSVHAIVTSPPYYKQRDYAGHPDQLGQEATPQEYLDKLFAIFMECRRVLRDDGTLWINLGDKRNPKTKALMGLPWKLALRLSEEGGWILRSDIIWSKLNTLPESVKDRPAQVHEYIFLFSKKRRYYFDQLAIVEPLAASTPARMMRGVGTSHKYSSGAPGQTPHTLSRPRPGLTKLEPDMPTTQKFGEALASLDNNGSGTNPTLTNSALFLTDSETESLSASRNPRSVWQLSTVPGVAGHFAAFPPALPEKCILAATSAYGCCAKCAAPFYRQIKRYKSEINPNTGFAIRKQLGWRPGCKCQEALYLSPKPAMVLDIFAGSGTTLRMAVQHGRQVVGIELNGKYLDLMERSLNGLQVQFDTTS